MLMSNVNIIYCSLFMIGKKREIYGLHFAPVYAIICIFFNNYQTYIHMMK